jgi:hypothetical protein
VKQSRSRSFGRLWDGHEESVNVSSSGQKSRQFCALFKKNKNKFENTENCRVKAIEKQVQGLPNKESNERDVEWFEELQIDLISKNY